MLSRLFPSPGDFTYRGSRVSLWLLGLILGLRLAIALGAVFDGHHTASVADGIPVDSFAPQGKQAFLSLLATLGASQFVFSALGMVLLLRYRALAPLLLLFLLVEYLARKGVGAYLPIARTAGAPGGMINWAMFGIMLIAFILSLTRRGTRQQPPTDV